MTRGGRVTERTPVLIKPDRFESKAAAGTIRGDFSLSNRENLGHASDSPDRAEREIALWFPDLPD
jgi:nucleoside diphosphate kinase